MLRRWAMTMGLVVGFALVPVVAAWAAPDGTAVVRFGRPDTGSPFPPPAFDHDQSSNARDNMTPRNVVISSGGSVKFEIRGRHQVAIYKAGTDPDDINVPPAGLFVNDATDRVELGPQNFPVTDLDWTTPVGTFAAPGRYLVICNLRPHFADFDMYGWVTVK